MLTCTSASPHVLLLPLKLPKSGKSAHMTLFHAEVLFQQTSNVEIMQMRHTAHCNKTEARPETMEADHENSHIGLPLPQKFVDSRHKPSKRLQQFHLHNIANDMMYMTGTSNARTTIVSKRRGRHASANYLLWQHTAENRADCFVGCHQHLQLFSASQALQTSTVS